MICPRCSVAEISETTQQCGLCGFGPSSRVLLEEPVVDEILEIVQDALSEQFQISAVLRLGETTFVYLAQDKLQESLVALKIVPVSGGVDPELARRFSQRVEAATELRHSHIVPIYSHGTSTSFAWYAMEHVQSKTLADVVRESGPMDLKTTARILEQVASALDCAHRQGLVHGNLKPTNIFVGEDGWVRVSDFGIADAFETRRGAGSQPVFRLPEYMAPEQFYARSVGASSDQYSLGVLAYLCLAGSLPFVGDSFEEVAQLQANEPPPRLTQVRPDVPVAAAEAVQRALHKVPAGRFQSVLDFTSRLSGAPPSRASLPTMPREQATGSPTLLVIDNPPPSRVVRVLGVIAAVLVIFGGVFLWQSDLGSRIVDSISTRGAPAAAVTLDPSFRQPPIVTPEARGGTVGDGMREDRPPAEPVPAATPSGRSRRTRAAPRRAPVPVPSEPGSLVINSKPWGRLFVDGEAVGTTPVVKWPIAAGSHVLRVERVGYEPWVLRIQVTANQTIRITDIELKARNP